MNCMKSVQIRGFFWSVFSCIWTEYGKTRTMKISIFGHFSLSDGPHNVPIYFFSFQLQTYSCGRYVIKLLVFSSNFTKFSFTMELCYKLFLLVRAPTFQTSLEVTKRFHHIMLLLFQVMISKSDFLLISARAIKPKETMIQQFLEKLYCWLSKNMNKKSYSFMDC